MEAPRIISLQDGAEGLRIVNGRFLRGELCNEFGEKSAIGKLLTILGLSDMNLVEMDPNSADKILKTSVIGLTYIQIALLHFLNDNLSRDDARFATSCMVDILIEPQRFLGQNAPLILTLDQIIHSYTKEELASVPQLDWESGDISAAVSTALVAATHACESEAGNFGSAITRQRSNKLNPEAAATLCAYGVWDSTIEDATEGQRHTNLYAWSLGNRAARVSAASFDQNLQRLCAGAVNEIQGYGMFELFKPTKEFPNQPVHTPQFIGKLIGPDGLPLDFKSLQEATKLG